MTPDKVQLKSPGAKPLPDIATKVPTSPDVGLRGLIEGAANTNDWFWYVAPMMEIADMSRRVDSIIFGARRLFNTKHTTERCLVRVENI
jgi:hypothetical protein